MSDEIIVAEIPKNTRETLRVGLSKFNGHDLINMRVWFEAESGEHRPGKAGVALRVALLPELIAALQKTEAEAIHRGLLIGEAVEA